MTTQEQRARLEQIEQEARQLRDSISRAETSCRHNWGETVSDPEPYQEAVFDHYEPHGSDPEPIYRYYPSTRPRWKRVCKLCGKVEYTKEQRPSAFAPHFSS